MQANIHYRSKNTQHKENNLQGLLHEVFYNFRQLSLMKQVITFFVIIYGLFSLFLIILKYEQLEDVIITQIRSHYYNEIIENFLNTQRNIKARIDSANYQEELIYTMKYVHFLRNYFKELNKKDFFAIEHKADFPFDPAYLKRNDFFAVESKLAEFNIMLQDFENLGEYYEKSLEEDSLERVLQSNLSASTNGTGFTADQASLDSLQSADPASKARPAANNFIMFFYYYLPLIYQIQLLNGLQTDSYYFLCYPKSNQGKSVYFKYPLPKPIGRNNDNLGIYDTIIDPIFEGLDLEGRLTGEKLEELKSLNWYFGYDRNINGTHRAEKFLRLVKIQDDTEPQNMIVTVIRFELEIQGEMFVVAFIQNINFNDYEEPYLNKTVNDDYEYISILNDDEVLYRVDKSKDTSFYGYDYNIDDNPSLILNYPDFLETYLKHGLFFRNFSESLNPNTLIFSQDFLDTYEFDYTINPYFRDDIRFFTFLNGINKYFIHQVRYLGDSQYQETYWVNTWLWLCRSAKVITEAMTELCSPLDYSDSESYYNQSFYYTEESSLEQGDYNNHPCLISDLLEYSRLVDLDYCMLQICMILSCEEDEFLSQYITDPALFAFLPDCDCLALFCFDFKTKEDVPYQIAPIKQYYEENIFNEVINKRFVIKSECRFFFKRKEQNQDSPFPYHIQFNYKVYYPFYKRTLIYIYMFEEKSYELLINTIRQDFINIQNILVIVYMLCVLVIGGFLVHWLNRKLIRFRDRIDDMRMVHRLIINRKLDDDGVSEDLDSEEKAEKANEQEEDSDEEILSETFALNNSIKDFNEEKSNRSHKSPNINLNKSNRTNELQSQYKSNSKNQEHSKSKKPLKGQKADQRKTKPIPTDQSNEREVYEAKSSRSSGDSQASPTRDTDELAEIYSIIKDNIEEFKLEFNIDKNVYIEDGFVRRYIAHLRKKEYTDFILPNFGANRYRDENTFLSSNVNQQSEEDFQEQPSEISKQEITDNLSVTILYEVLSCEYLSLSDYHKNFYFREFGQSRLINLESFINEFLFNDQTFANEITDYEKLDRSIKYYQYEIFLRWWNLYAQKTETEERL